MNRSDLDWWDPAGLANFACKPMPALEVVERDGLLSLVVAATSSEADLEDDELLVMVDSALGAGDGL
ncbi:MAG: hypothetical protein KAT29_15420 [Anaerolineales bacterium]|nr:hypothetical protein [Anaerolineales bacterium]